MKKSTAALPTGVLQSASLKIFVFAPMALLIEVKTILRHNYNTKHFKIKTVEVSDQVKEYFTPQKEVSLIPENLEE